MSENQELTPEEKKAFDALKENQLPDPQLEDQLVDILKNKNLIKPTTKKTIIPSWVYKVAASLFLISIGYFMGNYKFPVSAEQKYLLLLYEDESFERGHEMAKVKEYTDWYLALMEEGRYISGERLSEKKDVLSQLTKQENSNGNQISGFFIIGAKDYGEANQITKTNPHLKYGGSIELREIVID